MLLVIKLETILNRTFLSWAQCTLKMYNNPVFKKMSERQIGILTKDAKLAKFSADPVFSTVLDTSQN
jgi:hypothetical protein